MKNVYVVGGDRLIEDMFLNRGWGVVNNTADADLIQYTGGEDVSPALYKEERHPSTGNNPRRDAYEANIFLQEKGKPQAGICRGGQFLNVMCGGKMWQDVDRHALGGTHEATTYSGKVVKVTSTHHQMFDPRGDYKLLLSASRSTIKERGDGTRVKYAIGESLDVESVFYPEQSVLCFQPHPEYVGINHECQELYFEFLRDWLGV